MNPPENHTLFRQASLVSIWHGAILLLVVPVVASFISLPAALLWLVYAGSVLCFIHLQLWRFLHLNHPPGSSQLAARLGPANQLTLLRGLLISILGGFLVPSVSANTLNHQYISWLPGLLYVTAALLDALDGYVARKRGSESLLGEKLDREIDGIGLLTASLVAVQLGRLEPVYLLTGSAYYLFRGATWLRRKMMAPTRPLIDRPFARTIAGLQMGFVSAALFPLISIDYLHPASFIFMLPLLVGFIWDWLVVSDKSGRSGWLAAERFYQRFFPYFPTLCRFSLPFCTLLVYERIELLSPLSLPFFLMCLTLTWIGWTGRLASLVAALFLSLSPAFAQPTLTVLLLFANLLIITVFGTGRISLWQPEDRLVMRQ